ncbi:thermonuclease family protein [Devosia sp. RR2S18]|uniref:thermonuclease family protein n=1 Tax=Devosia rhizosphaerae TaxID=3049774 RepID=UPI00254124CC|nr:thermonuclease family protein [Devosia sp. RR2S18]WIJ24333.1 thermonuclease family protein [Devosia sp. RR2S18]
MLVLVGVAMLAVWLEPQMPTIAGAARVGDGDSFRLGEERIRLLGLDAPELNQACTDAGGRDWPCGRQARNRLAELLDSGPIHCQPEDRDQYGRLLARCSLGDRDIGQLLVAEGLAVSAGDYEREQATAKAARRGIWRGGFDLPRNWRDEHPRGQGGNGWLSLFGF